MKKSIFFLFLLQMSISSVYTFSFSPIIKEFDSKGNGRIQTFRIKNESDDPIAVQISMMTRAMNRDGEEINSDASDLFVIYPHQLILQPDDSQSIRVQWNGPENIDSEQAFRIIAEQLPISFNKENTNRGQLNIVYRYVGSVYIIPENPSSEISIESVTPLDDHLVIRVKNGGNRHTILEDLILTLSDGIRTVSLNYDDLPHMAGENILAGIVRDFSITRPSQLTGENISGEISYKETR
ncbi:MAG: molecular chaperone [Spirochaetaceae bacterium]|nr:molecular chaperone [Spirochaetaceae bacterium]